MAENPQDHPWIARASRPESLASSLAITSDPETLALLISTLTHALGDVARAVVACRDRIEVLEAKLTAQSELNTTIADTFISKIEPRLAALEARRGGIPEPGGN